MEILRWKIFGPMPRFKPMTFRPMDRCPGCDPSKFPEPICHQTPWPKLVASSFGDLVEVTIRLWAQSGLALGLLIQPSRCPALGRPPSFWQTLYKSVFPTMNNLGSGWSRTCDGWMCSANVTCVLEMSLSLSSVTKKDFTPWNPASLQATLAWKTLTNC